MDDDLYEDALDSAGAAVERCPDRADGHVLKGDALYRRGDFEQAERHYRRSIEVDPNTAAGHFGIGRILRTRGKYGEAGASFSRAAALDPDEPKYLRVLANHLVRRQDTIDMLKRYIELMKSDPGKEDKLGNVEAWLALLEFAGEEPISRMEKREPTEVPLKMRKGQGHFRMEVAGLKNRRFLFDTGATGMTVSRRIARKAGLESIRPYTIAGTGAGLTETGDLVLIDRVAVGDGIVLRNVPATVREPAGPEEGLVGPSLFGQMLITVDMKKERLSFGATSSGTTGRAIPFRNVGGEIMIPVRVNNATFNAMVDTGSARTIIGRTTVGRLPDMQAAPGQWFMGTTIGIGGPLADRKVVIRGNLEVAGRDYTADGMLSANLDGISRALESEVYVILGAPHLDDFVITIDYEQMTLHFDSHDEPGHRD